MKLSPTQIKVLRELAKPGAVARYVSSMTGGFFQLGTEAIRPKVMAQLRENKLIIRQNQGWSVTATITQAGHEALEAAEAKGG